MTDEVKLPNDSFTDESAAIANAMQVVGILADPTTVIAFAQIMAEPDEAIAFGMIDRAEEWFAGQFAAGHARLVADRVRDAWTTLHQAQGRA